MRKLTKWCFVICVLTMLLVASISTVGAQAAREPGSIWTTRNDCGDESQDVNHFNHGDWVYINGSGFNSAESRPWDITGQPGSADPSTTVASGTVVPVWENPEEENESQWTYGFCFQAYQIANDDAGEYKFGVGGKNDNYQVDPGVGSFDYSIGACTWTIDGGSQRVVSLTITGASVTIVRQGDGTYGPYTSSQSINLPAGNYTYSWVATLGNTGSGSGSFTVDPCPAASASAAPGACSWDGEFSKTDVFVTVNNASLTISGPGGPYGPYTTNTTVPGLLPGAYTYSWEALPGYSGSGSGSFTLIDCEPGKADVSVDIGACFWDEQGGKSYFYATLTLYNAELTIGGKTYSESGDIKLEAGSYHYTWVATGDNVGSGEGDVDVEGCEPATANVAVGGCSWVEMTSMTPVTITMHGALLDLYTDETVPVHIGQYGEGVSVVSLPPGVYFYTWAAEEDFVGSGRGEFTTLDCEPGKADAAINIGACTYNDGKSLTLVSITLSNAVLTIDGKEYFEFAELKLPPGKYAYSWEAVGEDFQGQGDGILEVGSCDPKHEDDPDPDVAAGGEGPSLIITLTPALLMMSGIALAWILIKHKVKQI